jgi:hypothetical protein
MRGENEIRQANYNEQLNWYNISVKPIVVTDYIAKYKPVLNIPSPNTTTSKFLFDIFHVIKVPTCFFIDPSPPFPLNTSRSTTATEATPSLTGNASSPTTTIFSDAFTTTTTPNRSTPFSNVSNNNANTAHVDNVSNGSLYLNNNSIYNSFSTSAATSPTTNSNNEDSTSYFSNNNKPTRPSCNNITNNYTTPTATTNNYNSKTYNTTTPLKRAIDYDNSLDTIDLTNSQPKRSKVNNDEDEDTCQVVPPAPAPSLSVDDDMINYEYGDNFYDDYQEREIIEEFNDEDDFAQSMRSLPHSPIGRFDNDDEDEKDEFDEFGEFDDDMMANYLVLNEAPSGGLPEIECKLRQARERQEKNTEDTRKAVINGLGDDELDRLANERTKISNEVKELNTLLEGGGENNKVQTDPDPEPNNVVILDDENSQKIEVSPFFNNAPIIPRSANIATTTSTTAATVTTSTSTLQSSSQPTFLWTRDVRKALIQTFKLSEFRPNQLEAINTTLNGEDVFVLMPTGGGKSLCYQLPAIITRYKRQGITFVVSPLLSLMQDQVEQLVKVRGIGAYMLNGTIDPAQKKNVYDELYNTNTSTQLIYITPELLCQSNQLRSALDNLYRKGKIARFVIDEAHCVSQWGHDFRPDYKLLSFLKQTYTTVPIMALTATANEAVQKDVITNLHMKNCKVLKQSFNRTNLVQVFHIS